MKDTLESLLTQHKLNHGKHDTLIRSVRDNNEQQGYITVMYNGYYKFRKGNRLWESDIDLLQATCINPYFEWVEDYRDLPIDETQLHVFEMKSNDSSRNYSKALSQLQRHKDMLSQFSAYDNIRTYYAYCVANTFGFEEVELK